MPTTRRRRTRTQTVPRKIEFLLGMGMGMCSYTDAELRELWDKYGEQVMRRHPRPFVAECLGLLDDDPKNEGIT